MFSQSLQRIRAKRIPGMVATAAIVMLLTPFVPTSVPQVSADVSPATCGTADVQLLGFSDALNKTTFGGFGVEELSAITYDPDRDVYYSVADRAGPVQSHVFTLRLPVSGASLGAPSIVGVTSLSKAEGTPFNGTSFDGEGIAISPRDGLLLASEGGSAAGEQPEVRRFSLSGTHREELAVPARFLIGTNNLSFESLAISPSGDSLFTASEGALPAVGGFPADGQTADLRSRIRILRYARTPLGFVPAEQYFYLTEPGRTAGDLGVAEIAALSDKELLVLERGFVAGQGNTIRVFRASLRSAMDVSGQPTLTAPGLIPVAKALLFDLADCPPSGAIIPPGATQPNALLDNFEGIALGPHLAGGRRALVLQSDDNAGTNQTTRLIALAVRMSGLVATVHQEGTRATVSISLHNFTEDETITLADVRAPIPAG